MGQHVSRTLIYKLWDTDSDERKTLSKNEFTQVVWSFDIKTWSERSTHWANPVSDNTHMQLIQTIYFLSILNVKFSLQIYHKQPVF